MGGSSTKTETSESFSGERNNEFNDLYDYLLGRVNNPQAYAGSLATPTNAATAQGITGLTDAANNPALQAFASGQYIDPATNKYLQSEIDAIKQNSLDQYGQAAQGIDSRFANRGFYDGSSHVSALQNAANQSNQNVANTVAGLENTAYQQGVGNMLSAQNALEGANSALASAGNTQWNQENQNLSQQYQAWKDQMGLTDQDISELLQYFNIGKNPTQTTTTDSDNGIGGILGSLAGGWASTLGKKG
ncbi:MAG: hypothetical protein P4N41_25720 [Negativicutes bacterium]|nr:hypothetical protein [Negativicutes bacterium]MDR3593074.1 hypothetical protein [Negativicutes bacterium]